MRGIRLHASISNTRMVDTTWKLVRAISPVDRPGGNKIYAIPDQAGCPVRGARFFIHFTHVCIVEMDGAGGSGALRTKDPPKSHT